MITIFLKNSKILKHDVITIQKSWYNIYQFTIHNSISQTYNFYYANHVNCESRELKICFFISKRIDIARIVYKTHSRNVISIKITLNNFDSNLQYTMKIHNVYNESNIQFSFVLKTLKTMFRIDKKFVNDEIANYIQNVIINDFNIYHSQ